MTVAAALPVKPMMPAAGTLSRRSLIGGLAGAVVLSAHGSESRPATVLERRFLFGSPAELLVSPQPGQLVASAASEVLALLQRINDRWNAWKPGEVTELNAAIRAGTSVSVSPAMVGLIRAAERLERASLGCFNGGIGGAVQAWGFHADEMLPGRLPHTDVLRRLRRARPSLSQLEINGRWVRSSNPHLQLDFGAYAKGVAIDLALDRLLALGVNDAVLNLGGNLAAMGQPGRRQWRIGIRDPAGDGLIANMETQGREAVVTSGSYERYRILDGERYTHILDPDTATPAPELVSVSVVHPSAGFADAAATALLVAGPQRWRKVAEQMGVTAALVVDKHGRGEVTRPLAHRLQPVSAAWRASMSIVS